AKQWHDWRWPRIVQDHLGCFAAKVYQKPVRHPGVFFRRCLGVSPREGLWCRFAEVQGEQSVG
ncbi:MAG: hypothetical protein V4719_06045, partial [Planctomycetota bacterium]